MGTKAALASHPVETLFPARRVHLVSGASGSGKTTWLLQFLDNWQRGEKVFGYAVSPAPFEILSYDRGTEEFNETCARVKLDASRFPFVPQTSLKSRVSLTAAIAERLKQNPGVKLFVVEGIALLTPDGKLNDYKTVGVWLSDLRVFCEDHDITIIGVCHSPKTREGEQYIDPRTRINGSGAWGAFSSTVVVVEKAVAGDPADSTRRVYFLPRNGAERVLMLDFRDGLLVEQAKPMTSEQRIIAYCATQPADKIYVRDDFRAVSALRDTALDAVLSGMVNTGRLSRSSVGGAELARGRYRFIAPKES